MADPAKYDITIRRGDDFLLFFRVKQPDSTAYVNLTGWTGRAQLRLTPAAVDPPLATFTVTLTNQTTTPGGVNVEMGKTATAALLTNVGVYDVELTDAATKVKTFLEGAVVVIQDVTR